uniref:Uncharacterized protein n=1 Tax=Pavo cristatus TaxID=9049 RepID=A0A8C9FJ91_PAVCR
MQPHTAAVPHLPPHTAPKQPCAAPPDPPTAPTASTRCSHCPTQPPPTPLQPNQKDIDKAELKSQKAAEALRRAVDKYNTARNDFEQRMEEREKRRLEQLERKKELQRLLEEEDSKLKGKSPKQATPGKVTRAQIEESIRKDQQQKENADTGRWEHRRAPRAVGTQEGGEVLGKEEPQAALLCLPSLHVGGKETSCLLEVGKQSCKVGTGSSQGCGLRLSFLSVLWKGLLRMLQPGFGLNSASFFPFPVQWRRRRLTWRSPWRRTSTDGSWRRGQWRPGRSRMPLPSSALPMMPTDIPSAG